MSWIQKLKHVRKRTSPSPPVQRHATSVLQSLQDSQVWRRERLKGTFNEETERVTLRDGTIAIAKTNSKNPQVNALEIAAEVGTYKLDRLLGLQLVPPTTRRKIGDQEFSVQALIPDTRPAAKCADCRGPSPRLNFLDLLIANIDRDPMPGVVKPNNLLIAKDGREIAIDHGNAFQWPQKNYLLKRARENPEAYYPGDDAYQRLKSLSEAELRDALAGEMGERGFKAFLDIRREYLEIIEKHRAPKR